MSRAALIAQNTFVQVMGRGAGTIFGLLTLGLMTRYLDTEGYGLFTTATTFLQFFGIIVDFGLSLTTVAMLSEAGVNRDKVLSNLLSLRVVSAVVFYALAPITVLFLPYPPEVKSGVLIAASSFFLISLNQVLTGVLQKELRMGRAAAAEVFGRVGLFLVVFVAARLDLGLGWMFGALVIGNALTVLWNWLLVRRLAVVRWMVDLSVWKDILRVSWPIGLSIVFNLIYLKGDVIILSLIRPQSEVGLYGAAYKILDVLTVIPIMFMGLVLPLLVASRPGEGSDGWAEFRRILQRAFDFMAVLAMPLVIGGAMVGDDLMTFFAGDEFTASGPMLRILILAAASVFFGSMFGHAVIAVKKQKPMIWGYAIDAVLATVAYLIVIPVFGAVGAAWVTVGSELFIAFATFLVVRNVSRFLPGFSVFIRALLAALLMAGVLRLLPDLHVLLRVLVGTIAYAAFAMAFRAVDIRTLHGFIRRGTPPAAPGPAEGV